jgi:hypothetical protein
MVVSALVDATPRQIRRWRTPALPTVTARIPARSTAAVTPATGATRATVAAGPLWGATGPARASVAAGPTLRSARPAWAALRSTRTLLGTAGATRPLATLKSTGWGAWLRGRNASTKAQPAHADSDCYR